MSDVTASSAGSTQQQAASQPTLHSLPMLNLNGGRDAILAYFENTWSLTELLFTSLASDEAYFIRPYHKTRHPLVFYYAHPVCFYVNKLLVSGLIEQPVNQEFELLFEVGVDEMTWDDLHEGESDVWPELSAVREYRRQVYELVHELIRTHPIFDEPVTMDKPSWALVMAFEHERIHLETSSVLIRELPLEHVRQPAGWPVSFSQTGIQNHEPVSGIDFPVNKLEDISEQEIRLGKPREWPTFGWDNEYGSDRRQVSEFRASRYLISNGEFHEFVVAGGYEERRFWSEDGWKWRQFRNIKWPTFWVQDGPAGSHRYKLRSTFAEIPMQWNWPAIVNFYEARAYCAWRSELDGVSNPYRLLSEAESLAIRDRSLDALPDWRAGDNDILRLDSVMGNDAPVNHNLRYGSESPVNAFAANNKGIHDALGNVWQWCEDAFHPLPGFEIHPYYTDFSTPCYDGEHQMIMGGSFISTGDEASAWSRFHFRPHFFQHAGFRLVQDRQRAESNKYESSSVVNQYLLFHYGSEEEQRDVAIHQDYPFPRVENLIDTTVNLMRQYAAGSGRALDLGCAVGRSSFELARAFGEVVGVDWSEAFIETANLLKAQKSLPYRRWETGRYYSELEAVIDDEIDRSRVHFYQGDAQQLTALPQLKGNNGNTQFDAILLSNLLCRLSDPAACLRQFVESDDYLARGGILVISSPNSWMEQYTREANYIDGADSDATLGALGNLLQGFKRLHEQDLPFMIREHRRKYEFIVSQVSVWRKES